ncbi:unnamed protein product [Ilex paraguariensis]|uniref:Uncharacterized protein n=1 Tax=Ilex paraguariensis TaxID=185542 RepID=A0ABC8QZT2_9AQUA
MKTLNNTTGFVNPSQNIAFSRHQMQNKNGSKYANKNGKQQVKWFNSKGRGFPQAGLGNHKSIQNEAGNDSSNISTLRSASQNHSDKEESAENQVSSQLMPEGHKYPTITSEDNPLLPNPHVERYTSSISYHGQDDAIRLPTSNE